MVGKAPTYNGDTAIAGGSEAGSTYNTTNINISGNVDQRSIDQIRNVITSSPKEVQDAREKGRKNAAGLRRARGR
jgi:hypothetical protein